MKTLAIMSGAKYDATTAKLVERAPDLGVERVLVYDDVWVDAHPFRRLNSWLWEHPGDRNGKRGFGWYSWKPLILIDALDRSADGDVVAYVDGDSEPTGERLDVLFDVAAREGAMLFSSVGHKQRTWCTQDCFYVMGMGAGSMKSHHALVLAGSSGTHGPFDRFYEAPAGCARFMAFQKGPWKPRQLLMEWLTYAVNPMATTFDASELLAHAQVEEWIRGNPSGSEHPGFEEHRTEQAILTNLAHRYGYKLWRECDDSGEGWDVDRDVLPRPLFRQVRRGACPNGTGSRFRNVPMPAEGT